MRKSWRDEMRSYKVTIKQREGVYFVEGRTKSEAADRALADHCAGYDIEVEKRAEDPLYEIDIPVCGRYRLRLRAKSEIEAEGLAAKEFQTQARTFVTIGDAALNEWAPHSSSVRRVEED